MKNENLHKAKATKNDEFYTRLEDIEKELEHYTEHFKGKVAYCNCDDANRSNFFKYFSINFQKLGLKKLITSGLKIDCTEDGTDGTDGTENGTGIVAIQKGNDIDIYDGNGDFRSEECIEFLKEADMVVTNPPFSLFREYVAQLMQYGKKFLIIGNMNAITYKEIFSYIKNNELWLGITSVKDFIQPNGEIKKFGNICWFTNLEHKKRNEELILYKHYSPTEYPKFENYDAIEVSKVAEIPMDYDGVCAVPISFLDKYCPNQFRIVGLGIAKVGLACGVQQYKREHRKYRKNIQKRGVVDGDLYMVENGIVKVPYARILIQKIN